MKRCTVLFLFSFLVFGAWCQEIDAKQIDFINQFSEAVSSHNQSKVIKCTDKDYRNEQIDFLGGNKKQFVDELFGGFDIQSGEYINLQLEEIELIHVIEAVGLGDGRWEYTFHVKTN